jgi:hypothetical protein
MTARTPARSEYDAAMFGHPRRLLFACLAGLAAHLAPSPARAEDTSACTKSYENAQILKKKREYISARRELVTCIHECPVVVQRECGQWLEALETVVPSVVIHAEAMGEDRTEVKVELDGKVIAEKIDGKGIDVDPGQHDFRFTLAGFPQVRKNLLVHEGEQLRVVRVVFEHPEASTGLGQKAPPATEKRRPVPPALYFVGAVAVAGGAGFAAFGLVGTSQRSRLERDCSPRCTDSAVEGVRRNLLMADISLGVGVLAATTGVVLWLTRPTVAAAPDRASLGVAPSPTGASFLATVPF